MKSRNLRDLLNEIVPEDLSPGQVIASTRRNFGISQDELAEVTGIQRTNISAIENGKVEVTSHYAEIFGVALGIHPSSILYPNGELRYSKKLKEIKSKAERLMKTKLSKIS